MMQVDTQYSRFSDLPLPARPWIGAENPPTVSRRAPAWLAAIAAHLVLAALFMVSLTTPEPPVADSTVIDLVSAPATPPAKPQPVIAPQSPRPLAMQRIVQRRVLRLDPASRAAMPLLRVAPVPVQAHSPEAAPAPAASIPQTAPPQTYLDALYGHLAQYRRYPRALQQARVEGTPLLRFTLNHQGQVLAYRIERGSGHAALDAEVLAMIERAQPLPPPPADMPDPIEIVIPVQFSVR